MTHSNAPGRKPSFLGRLLYSGVLAYMAIDGFRHNDHRVDVARQKDVPLPDLLVPAATGMLLVANIGILCWRYPRAAAGALAVFFLTTTPAIHDFWNIDDDADRQANKTNFLKNGALLGGALLLLADASRDAADEHDQPTD
ncbi:DoxX family protein [Halocalculus aciditolerans]|uniref:DoxX family protein n=1 Tax=Halocalculus aciditolerans TaxID=1383812 RepID=A0A830FL57_9EURY|nr:DoxX family protein [Halocalculus aciditolerans]GGL66583.1 hypothetical protein GCM10009039_25650 [Halocalculus aciditolerans]